MQASLNRSPNPVGVDAVQAATTDRLTHTARLSTGYQAGNVQAQVELAEAGNSSSLSLQGNAQASYDFSDTFHVGAVVYGGRSQQVSTHQLRPDQRPDLTTGQHLGVPPAAPERNLLLDADVDVLVNQTLVRSFRARAGVLTLRNIPLTSSSGSVTIRAQNAGQRLEQEFPYTSSDVVLTERRAALEARAGCLTTKRRCRPPDSTVSDRLTLAGSLDASVKTQVGEFSARYNVNSLIWGPGCVTTARPVTPSRCRQTPPIPWRTGGWEPQ